MDFFGGVAGRTRRVRNELKSVETEIKYAGYLDQQRKAIDKLKKAEQRAIPANFEYAGISGLSREMQETLARVRPQTLGQASRIPGRDPGCAFVAECLSGSGREAEDAGDVREPRIPAIAVKNVLETQGYPTRAKTGLNGHPAFCGLSYLQILRHGQDAKAGHSLMRIWLVAERIQVGRLSTERELKIPRLRAMRWSCAHLGPCSPGTAGKAIPGHCSAFPVVLEAWGGWGRGGGLYCWSADADANAAGVLPGS